MFFSDFVYYKPTNVMNVTHCSQLTKIKHPLKSIKFSPNFIDGDFGASLPNTLTHLEFIDSNKYVYIFSSEDINNLPKTLTHLKLSRTFNIAVDNLPNSLTHLDCGDSFAQEVDHLPSHLTHLTLGYNFNQKIDNLPLFLVTLKIGSKFNQNVDHLPQSLKILKICDGFNQNVDHLPNFLTNLSIGDNFTETINNLPNNLTHLTLGHRFNQEITFLPASILQLSFGKNFNQSIDYLPPNLTHLKLGDMFKHATPLLPNSLTHVTIGSRSTCVLELEKINSNFKYLECRAKPSMFSVYQGNSLTHLTVLGEIYGPLNQLPHCLTHLKFDHEFYQHPISYTPPFQNPNIVFNEFPTSLTHLSLNGHFLYAIPKLPPNLKFAAFGSDLKYPPPCLSLSSSIETIEIGTLI